MKVEEDSIEGAAREFGVSVDRLRAIIAQARELPWREGEALLGRLLDEERRRMRMN